MRSKEVLVALAMLVSVSMGGCAGTPAADGAAPGKQVASTVKADGSSDEVYCQTDDDTGSRLSHHTTCNDANSADAQDAARAMQHGGYLGPKGN
jgi:hypothetical protein